MPLTYLSLKCVLEHMEANQRIFIASRCPALRHIEKSVPLHLHLLRFADLEITLNNFTYQFAKNQATVLNVRQRRRGRNLQLENEMDTVTSGDILFEDHGTTQQDRLPKNCPMMIYFENSGRIRWRKLSKTLNFHVAMKKLVCNLFDGRRVIKVDTLEVTLLNQKLLILPENFKVHVLRNLNTGQNSLQLLSHIVSFPQLEEHFVDTTHQKALAYGPTAKRFVVTDSHAREPIVRDPTLVAPIPNKNVEFRIPNLHLGDVFFIAQDWIGRQQEVGTCYKFRCDDFRMLRYTLLVLKRGLNGASVWLNNEKEFSVYDIDAFSIRINDTSEILVYAYRTHGTLPFINGHSYVKMEVVPSKAVTRKHFLLDGPTFFEGPDHSATVVLWWFICFLDYLINFCFRLKSH